MGLEDNKRIVQRWQELYNQNRLDQLKEVVADDLVSHSLMPGVPSGLAGAIASHQGALTSFPDVQTSIDQLVAEGDTVVARFTTRGTHTGPFGPMPATGRPFEIQGVSIFRVAGGKIVEHWGVMDQAGLMRQLAGRT